VLCGNYTVYPGHGPSTTMDAARASNPYMREARTHELILRATTAGYPLEQALLMLFTEEKPVFSEERGDGDWAKAGCRRGSAFSRSEPRVL
jgi:glyoxylase-like metal-dependent hydrolase (beta-lactamase superfamily II)